MSRNLERHPDWIVCRNLRQFPVSSIDVLPRWAERGQVRPDDYLVNPSLDRCLQAKDVPDLNAIFRTSRFGRLGTLWRALTSHRRGDYK